MEKQGLILIVDDDPDICNMLEMMLQFNGYATTSAATEEAALEMLSSRQFDLIIMDVLLSGSRGTDLCRRLKQDTKTSSIPILMFSALSQSKRDCLAAGADDFIEKPFELSYLLKVIERNIEQAKNERLLKTERSEENY